ncbi:MAG: 4'-phosphopantetheinyl transferase superfamily protein [Candidatus Aminicenantes bacterium]|nr:4'-phosphopantetheinyl transferase superfamily protein [Candidatus Aminicenantes bacterium]
MEIHALSFDRPLADSLFLCLLNRVDIRKREKIKRYWRWHDAHRALLADLLLRRLLSLKTNLPPSHFSFSLEKYGKPFLSDGNSLHFNVSHSGEWVVCIFDNGPVGVDIEQIKDIEYGLFEDCFACGEWEFLQDAGFSESLKRFYQLWTLKESYIKMTGKGFDTSLSSFAVKPHPGGKYSVVVDGMKQQGIFFREYDIDQEYRLSVCALNEDFPRSWTPVGLDKVLDFYLRDGK